MGVKTDATYRYCREATSIHSCPAGWYYRRTGHHAHIDVCYFAHDAFVKKQSSAKSLVAVKIERDILAAKVALRSESSLVEVDDWRDRMISLHSKSEKSLFRVTTELRSYRNGDGGRGLRRLIEALNQYNDAVHELLEDGRLPAARRSKSILARWRQVYTNLLSEANDQADTLSLDIVRADPANNDLIDVNRFAWNARVMAGPTDG